MKQLIFLLIVFSVLSACERKSGVRKINPPKGITTNQVDKQINYQVKVIAITDGDTFKGLTSNNEEQRFRIYGIDAPERKQAFSAKSKEYLSQLIYGKTVSIKVSSKDRYGRFIVWVYTPEGNDVSAEMLKSGMAWHYKEYDDTELYANLESEAKTKRIGLWIENDVIAPWDFRAR